MFSMQHARKVRDHIKYLKCKTVKLNCQLTNSHFLLSITLNAGLIIATNQPKNESSRVLFALAALFHLLGKFTSNLSLQWIPYTTQIVGKGEQEIR